MIDLPAARADLLNILEPVPVPVHDHLPARVNPPALLIEPGEPFIADSDENQTFGTTNVNFDVFVIVAAGQPKKQTDDLDTLLTQSLAAIVDSPNWFIDSVRQPFTLTLAGQSWLASLISVHTQVHL